MPLIPEMLTMRDIGDRKKSVMNVRNMAPISKKPAPSLECYASLLYLARAVRENLMELSDEEKQELLRLARASIASALHDQATPGVESESHSFQEPCGVFVTLRISGELRGCIGYVEPRVPLVKAVREIAIRSAFDDPRFPPLTRNELEQIDIEISILSPLKRIQSIEEIEAGKHGLVVELLNHRGLLLPQVAVEYQWDRKQFLRYTCLKAGLPEDAWENPDVVIFIFTADTFSETHERHAA
jgi:AmmeMemoRadiSam system protein A